MIPRNGISRQGIEIILLPSLAPAYPFHCVKCRRNGSTLYSKYSGNRVVTLVPLRAATAWDRGAGLD